MAVIVTLYDPTGAAAEAVTVKDNVEPVTPDNVEAEEVAAQDGSLTAWPPGKEKTTLAVTVQVMFNESLNKPEEVTCTVMLVLGLKGSLVFEYPWVTNTGARAGGVPDTGAENATL